VLYVLQYDCSRHNKEFCVRRKRINECSLAPLGFILLEEIQLYSAHVEAVQKLTPSRLLLPLLLDSSCHSLSTPPTERTSRSFPPTLVTKPLRPSIVRCTLYCTQSDGPVRFLIFCSISIILLASLVAGRKLQLTAGIYRLAGNVLHHTYPLEYQICSSHPRQKSCWASSLRI
jgi:hypothetical protein